MKTFELLMSSPWVMMACGLLLHLLFKAMKVKDNTKRSDATWSLRMFVRDYVFPFIFSLIASFIFTAISIEQGWAVWTAAIMSYASSSALYNIYPVITNPEMWRKIAGTFVSKATGGSNEQP